MQYFEYLINARMQLYYKPGAGAGVGARVGTGVGAGGGGGAAAGFIKKYYKKM